MQGAVVVRMRFPRPEDFRHRYTRDLSRGGVFIQTPNPRPPGSKVVLVLEPPASDQVSLLGEVVTAVDAEDARARGLQPGMGIRFLDLEDKRGVIEAILERLAPGGAVPPPVPAAGPAAAAPAPPAAVDVSRITREAQEFLAANEGKDYYHLLGVPRESSSVEVRRAFLKLTRRFHPDNYFRKAPEEVTRLLEDIYDLLTRAYETLLDRDRRISYDLSIGYLGGNRDGVTPEEMMRVASEDRRRKESPRRVARAEQLYAQAVQEAAAGQTAKALANLRLALAFDPENPQILAKLQEIKAK
jgi:uncharacterized protein (TIGR02266 family)